ncbi:MAG: hypothetical protein V3U82_04670 [Robiginitomaculum sp.]
MKLTTFFPAILTLAATVLSACADKQPLIIPMPNSYYQSASELKRDCIWKTADLELFKQQTQRLTFRYQFCENSPRPADFKISIKDNASIFIIDNRIKKTVLLVQKLGPTEPKDFLARRRQNARKLEACALVQHEDGYWITRDETAICHQKVIHTIGGQTRYWFTNGIVFAHIVELDELGIDPASVRYENHG